jgi:hypothetical protein
MRAGGPPCVQPCTRLRKRARGRVRRARCVLRTPPDVCESVLRRQDINVRRRGGSVSPELRRRREVAVTSLRALLLQTKTIREKPGDTIVSPRSGPLLVSDDDRVIAGKSLATGRFGHPLRLPATSPAAWPRDCSIVLHATHQRQAHAAAARACQRRRLLPHGPGVRTDLMARLRVTDVARTRLRCPGPRRLPSALQRVAVVDARRRRTGWRGVRLCRRAFEVREQ